MNPPPIPPPAQKARESLVADLKDILVLADEQCWAYPDTVERILALTAPVAESEGAGGETTEVVNDMTSTGPLTSAGTVGTFRQEAIDDMNKFADGLAGGPEIRALKEQLAEMASFASELRDEVINARGLPCNPKGRAWFRSVDKAIDAAMKGTQ